jgi:hypothetical protein
MTKLFGTRRDVENMHIFLWLMKDNAWCHDWHMVGVAMIFPTLAVQAYLTWRSRHDIHEIFHSVAVLLWIAANAIWMIGEFFYDDTWRFAPECFFGAGLASMAFYYAVHFRRMMRGEQSAGRDFR